MKLLCKILGHKWGPVYTGNTSKHTVPHRYDCLRCDEFGSPVLIRNPWITFFLENGKPTVRTGPFENAYERENNSQGDPFIEHLRGIPWWEAAIPPRKHECWAQTRGFISLNSVQRCPCGAIRMPRHKLDRVGWSDRNSRTER